MKSWWPKQSLGRMGRARLSASYDRGLFVVAGLHVLWADMAQAQGYYGGGYDYEADALQGPTTIQKIATSSASSLFMVFVGALGLFLFATAGDKGERAERKRAQGLLCILAVIALAWYRFSLWNDPTFNSR